MLRTTLAAFAASTAISAAGAEPVDLRLWHHGVGSYVEYAILAPMIDDFNAAQEDYRVTLELFEGGSYEEAVAAAAEAGGLPDILDVEGHMMPLWAWAGYLQPLGLAEDAVAGFLPGAVGRVDGEIYSVGLWDAAVAMMARCSVLDDYGIRRPTLDAPWTLEEFDAALTTLADSGDFDHPLDLGMAWTGEWYPYAFGPFLQSFGGDLIDRDTYATAEGALNGDAALAFGEWWQSLFARDLVPGPDQDPADRAMGLIDGRYALSWNGNFAALGVYDAFGGDACFLPAPDFGNGPVIGAGSWQFAASADTDHVEGVRRFIEHALQPGYLVAFAEGTELIPATREAASGTDMYAEGAPLAMFYGLSERQARLRPVTPAYPAAARVFERTLADIAEGADVEEALDDAVARIDADIAKNDGYGHGG